MRALLSRFPDAGVVAVTADGSFVDPPSSLPLDRQVVLPAIPINTAAVAAAWQRAHAEGYSLADSHRLDGCPVTVYTVDVRETHGVFVCIAVARDEDGDDPVKFFEHTVLPPRFTTVRRDEAGTVLAIDEATVEMFGWTLEELSEAEPLKVIHPDDVERALNNWIDVISNPGSSHRYRGRFRCSDGSWQWIEFTNHNRLDDPEHGDVLSEMVDISNEMAAQESVQEQEELLRELAEALPSGVVHVDAAGGIRYANDRLFELIGNQGATTILDQLRAVVEDDLVALRSAVAAVLERGENQDLRVRFRLSGDGDPRVCSITMRPLYRSSAAVTGAIACIDDITESARMQQELEVRATFDTLTASYNRSAIMGALEGAVSDERQTDSGTAAIFIDLDHFKQINDSLGHAAGDRLLTVVADRLREAVRLGDTFGRLGGDEFLVVCPGIARPEVAMKVADRIAEQVASVVELNGKMTHPQASIGVAWAMNGEIDSELLVARADLAMYESKRRGDGRPARWTAALVEAGADAD